jgi:cell division protein FtsN
MRNPILIAAIFFTLIFVSCGNKKENTEDVQNTDSEMVDQTLDTSSNYGNIISNGLSDESGIIDSSKKEPMVYISPSKEIQIDPPVDNKSVNNKTISEPVKEEPVKEKNIKEKTVKEKAVVKSHEKRFYVVAGSFKKYSNAHNLFELFKKKGYTPLILPKNGGYNRVAIVSYSQESEARKALKKVRAEHGDITFWLYKW